MKSRRWVYAVIDPLRRRIEKRFPDPETARFLQVRRARVIIEEKHTNNFYAVRASPVTDISVEREKLRLRMKLIAQQRLHVAVINPSTLDTLAEVIVPISASPDTIALHLDGIVVKLELDPAPTADVSP